MASTQEQGEEEEEDVHVVLEQTLLNVEEVFVYRIPPMKTSGGHRAEDWNLATPLATCSLKVLRRDSSLLINIYTQKPKPGGPEGATAPQLFAQCQLFLADTPGIVVMEHWVEPVVDSSRYFVVRISDNAASQKKKREAHIGVGFRERTDATNFRESLQEYENALRREKKAEAMHQAYENEQEEEAEETTSTSGGPDDAAKKELSPLPAVSKLSLKEGEKIHISMPISMGAGTTKSPKKDKPTSPKNALGKGGLLLKKPPPPAPLVPAEASDELQQQQQQQQQTEAKSDKPASSEDNDDDDDGGDGSSTGAVGEMENENDDAEWGDFESS